MHGSLVDSVRGGRSRARRCGSKPGFDRALVPQPAASEGRPHASAPTNDCLDCGRARTRPAVARRSRRSDRRCRGVERTRGSRGRWVPNGALDRGGAARTGQTRTPGRGRTGRAHGSPHYRGPHARVAEAAYAGGLKPPAERHVGSSPTPGTRETSGRRQSQVGCSRRFRSSAISTRAVATAASVHSTPRSSRRARSSSRQASAIVNSVLLNEGQFGGKPATSSLASQRPSPTDERASDLPPGPGRSEGRSACTYSLATLSLSGSPISSVIATSSGQIAGNDPNGPRTCE
jgi:hypothetical protein